MPILNVITGLGLVFFGRHLFWLFVAIVGFVAGLDAGRAWFPDSPQQTVFIVAILLGVIGALLALMLQRVAIGVAGFLAGSHLAVVLLQRSGANVAAAPWTAILVGGLAGSILLLMLFDPALIILSTLVGAALVVDALPPLDQLFAAVVFLGLLITGSVFQFRRVTA
jgi:hypothetical protein